jgi:hypothetical protein
MDLKQIESDGLDWIQVAQDTLHWQTLYLWFI